MALDAAAWAEIERLYRAGKEPLTLIAVRFGITVRRIQEVRTARGWPLRSRKARKSASLPARGPERRDGKKPSCKSRDGATREDTTPTAPTADAWTAGERWQTGKNPRSPPAPDATSAASMSEGTTVSSPPSARSASRKALVRRLYRAIDIKLQRLEKRMTSGDEPTIADSERETRELAHMIRGFEKVTEVAADIAQHAAQQSSKPTAGSPRGAARKQPAACVSADAERMRHEIAQRLERLHRARTPGK